MIKPILRYIPHEYNWDVVGSRFLWYLLTATLIVVSIVSIYVKGFNLGIDFAGGVLIEARNEQKVDIAKLRGEFHDLDIGEVSIVTSGETGQDAIIRVPQQKGGDEAQAAAKQKSLDLLAKDSYQVRRVDVVGAKVGNELIIQGALAVALAIIAIAIYVWFRFEWQFALGTVLALCNDVLTTLGVFSVFQLNFDLTGVAAVLTIAGYSVNDSVVVYDRVREMLRRYRKMALPDLLNNAVNRVMPRTLLTVFTVALTVVALLILGGEALWPFSVALAWGLFVGTFSSIRVGMPVLLYFDLRRDDISGGAHVPELERGKQQPAE